MSHMAIVVLLVAVTNLLRGDRKTISIVNEATGTVHQNNLSEKTTTDLVAYDRGVSIDSYLFCKIEEEEFTKELLVPIYLAIVVAVVCAVTVRRRLDTEGNGAKGTVEKEKAATLKEPFGEDVTALLEEVRLLRKEAEAAKEEREELAGALESLAGEMECLKREVSELEDDHHHSKHSQKESLKGVRKQMAKYNKSKLDKMVSSLPAPIGISYATGKQVYKGGRGAWRWMFRQ